MAVTHPAPTRRGTAHNLLVIGALLVSFAGLFAWRSWVSAKDEQLLQLETVAELTERATDRYFQLVQLALGELAEEIVERKALADTGLAQRLLARFNARHSELLGTNLLGLDGRFLATSAGTPPGDLPSAAALRDFGVIVAGLQPETPMELARPLVGPVVKRWIFPMRYTVRDASGAPVAFLVAAAPVEMIQSFWSSAPVIARSSIALVRDDAYLISRYPVPPGADHARVYGEPREGAVFRHMRATGWPKRGRVEGANLLSGEVFVSAFKRLEHYPVTLIAGVALAEVRAVWWRRIRGPVMAAALLAALWVWGLWRIERRELQWQAERATAEEQLHRRQIELAREQALRERDEMLDVMAHEVRQPLNNASAAMQNLQGVLLREGSAQSQAGLQRAQAVLTQVLANIDNTLAVAALLAQPQSLRREDTDIDLLVQLALDDLPPGSRRRIRVDRQTRTRTAAMDIGLMRLALRNLLANALRYADPAAEILVRIADSDEPLALLIDVVDHGPGIEAELLPRLFERGSRGNAGAALAGHGLGLYIVKRVMDLHGGAVEAITRPGEGLTMRLVIDQSGRP